MTDKQLAGFVNIDIDNIARWIFKEGVGDNSKWEEWIAKVPIPISNAMFNFSIPGKGYASVLSRRIEVTKESRQALIDAGMIEIEDTVASIVFLDLYVANRSDMADSAVTGRTTLILPAKDKPTRQFLSVPDAINNDERFNYEEYKANVGALMTPVAISMIILENGYAPLLEKKVSRTERRRANKSGIPIIIQKVFDLSFFKPDVQEKAADNNITSAELIMNVAGIK